LFNDLKSSEAYVNAQRVYNAEGRVAYLKEIIGFGSPGRGRIGTVIVPAALLD
jgi:hypothetical protein